MSSIDTIFKQLPKLYLRELQLKIEPQCSICYTDFEYNEKVKLLTCGHFFHTHCVKQWFERSTTCPYCQKQVTANVDDLRITLKRRKKLVTETVSKWEDDLKDKPLSEMNYLDLRFLLYLRHGVQFTGILLKDEIIHILEEREKMNNVKAE